MQKIKYKTNLQVALDEKIKTKAVLKARKYGFDNLPSMVRYIIVNIINDELIPTRLYNIDIPFFDKKTQKNIEIALKEYKNGKYISLKSKKEIQDNYARLNAEIAEDNE